MRVKFYEKEKAYSPVDKKEKNISIHALTAGKMVKGEISCSDEILFYTIRVSLDDKKKDALVTLTKLKGDYIIFASKNG